MGFNGNWIDLTIILFIVFYSYQGTKRGFLVLMAEMVSFIFSFIISLRYYDVASTFLTSNFQLTHNLANILGFIFIALAIQFTIARLFTQVYKFLPGNLFHSKFNHLLGLFPAAVDGLIICAFILSAVIALPLSPSLKSHTLDSVIGSELISKTSSVERSLNNIFGTTIQDSLSFLTVKTGSTQNIDLNFHTSNYKTDSASENQMLLLINKERDSRGLTPLTRNEKLQLLARKHSRDMLKRGYFSHINPNDQDPFDRMHTEGIYYRSAGENLAYAPNTKIAHVGLMNSPGHKANILNTDFNQVGIGVIDAGIYGKMFTQEFTN